MSCPATTLAPAASMTCTATHNFDQADLDAAQGGTLLCPVPGEDSVVGLYNVVSVDSSESEPVTDNLCIPVFVELVPVPTLGTWSLWLMILLMLATAGFYLGPTQLRRFR